MSRERTLTLLAKPRELRDSLRIIVEVAYEGRREGGRRNLWPAFGRDHNSYASATRASP
ncbi:MAG TPA: hypothetical protein VFH48_10475 [Chloroflexota bacterium]|nr:hypothetical protein [Chloroflexota bacterium]